MNFFVELDKLILILIWKTPPKKGKVKPVVKRDGDREGETFHMRYEDLL